MDGRDKSNGTLTILRDTRVGAKTRESERLACDKRIIQIVCASVCQPLSKVSAMTSSSIACIAKRTWVGELIDGVQI